LKPAKEDGGKVNMNLEKEIFPTAFKFTRKRWYRCWWEKEENSL